MAKVLVLYYSAFGYVAVVARSIADGARSAGASVDIKRVADEASRAAPDRGILFNAGKSVPVATVEDLVNYDAIIVGSPTRFGRLSAPVAGFLEQAGELASRGALHGKVGGAFASPTSPDGGQEAASMSILTNLLYFGMVVVGAPYSATTVADSAGQRHPSPQDLDGARRLGRLIAQTAQKLSGRADPGAADIEEEAENAAAPP
jgi:NAD(P)H dehydrogenase (quinone)